MPIQDDYQVTLSTFEGPLDLLLFLIRRAEVDITAIPVSDVTNQYLDFLNHIEAIDIDLAGEFLVMAATLVEIKSRVLQAQREKRADPEGDHADSLDLDESDPRYELVQQLLAYQRYRNAAEDLDKMRHEFALRFPAQPGRRKVDDDQTDAEAGTVEVALDDAHVFDLFEAYERIIESVDFSRLGDHEVQDDDTPIGLHQEDLVDRLARASGRRITLQQAWLGRTRNDVIGLFLATLELVRQRRVIVRQDDIDGEIMLELNEDPVDPAAAEDDPGLASTEAANPVEPMVEIEVEIKPAANLPGKKK